MSRETLAVDHDARPTLRIDGAVWLTALALVVGGALYLRSAEPPGRTLDALRGAVSIDVPRGWASSERDGVLSVEHPSLDGMPPSVRIQKLADTMDPLAQDLALTRLQEERAAQGAAYRVLHVDEVEDAFGGNHATLVWWAMTQDPPGSRPGDAVLPHVVEGVDALVLAPGGEAFHVAAFAAADGVDVRDELERTLRGVRVIGGGS